jgi:hypothetical protein
MKTFYDILLMYAGAFAIGMFVAAIIWVLVKTMSFNTNRKKSRQAFQEMKQMN